MKEIKRFLDSRVGTYSFYFEDLASGYTYCLNEKLEMPSAGCIKVPIGIALLKEIELGRFTLESNVKVSREDMVEGPGIIHEFEGREYSFKELLVAMLMQSDNTATNKIIREIGPIRVNEIIKEMELKNTHLKRSTTKAKPENDEMDNISSSYDLAQCLKILSLKTFLNEENSNLMIDILKRQQTKNRIPFYFPKPEKSNVANKAGSMENVENDMALIMLPKGNFILTVMSAELTNNVYGTVTITRIGKMMWDILDKDWV